MKKFKLNKRVWNTEDKLEYIEEMTDYDMYDEENEIDEEDIKSTYELIYANNNLPIISQARHTIYNNDHIDQNDLVTKLLDLEIISKERIAKYLDHKTIEEMLESIKDNFDIEDIEDITNEEIAEYYEIYFNIEDLQYLIHECFLKTIKHCYDQNSWIEVIDLDYINNYGSIRSWK